MEKFILEFNGEEAESGSVSFLLTLIWGIAIFEK